MWKLDAVWKTDNVSGLIGCVALYRYRYICVCLCVCCVIVCCWHWLQPMADDGRRIEESRLLIRVGIICAGQKGGWAATNLMGAARWTMIACLRYFWALAKPHAHRPFAIMYTDS